MAERGKTTRDEPARGEGQADEGGLSLEGRLSRLEEILARMESEEIGLEEALKLFEEGIGHVRKAERVLSEAELRVEELLADGTTDPVEADEDP